MQCLFETWLCVYVILPSTAYILLHKYPYARDHFFLIPNSDQSETHLSGLLQLSSITIRTSFLPRFTYLHYDTVMNTTFWTKMSAYVHLHLGSKTSAKVATWHRFAFPWLIHLLIRFVCCSWAIHPNSEKTGHPIWTAHYPLSNHKRVVQPFCPS